jgi:hypothetical protein
MAQMPDDSKLILEKAYCDERNLDHWFLYCRKCHLITDMIGPTVWELLRGKGFKCLASFDPTQEKCKSHYFSKKISNACKEDGVL